MSRSICLMGESGSGKTTAMRNLNPDTTYYIDCDKKGLSWRGWRNQYNEEKKNYKHLRDLEKLQGLLRNLSEKAPHIKTIVIDTLNTCMMDHEITEMKSTGFGKWIDLAQDVWEVCSLAGSLRDDLTVVIVMHSETVRDDSGYIFTRIRTNGRKLEKVVLESLFATVLLAKIIDGRHVFETQARFSTAKTPMGCFSDFEIENDIAAVIAALDEYEGGLS